MARKNPLGTIKDVAVGTAKGGVELGLSVAGQVASKATETVTSLIPGRKPTAPAKGTPPDLEPAEPAAASRKSQGDPMTHPEPAPVQKPLTSIDAGADVSEVGVTPADIAAAVKKAPAKKAPAKKAAAKKAPAKKAPAKKASAKKTAASTPGDKLPPRTT